VSAKLTMGAKKKKKEKEFSGLIIVKKIKLKVDTLERFI
jgi:hypothetical protein